MKQSLTNINHRFQSFIVSKNREVDNRLSAASTILGCKPQCRSSYAINFFEDVNMIFQFFSGSRHLGFEDIQAMVNLISDPRQIYGLPIGSSLDNLAIYLVLQLHNVCILSCNPLASPRFTRQGVETQSILRCNEASSLPSNEVLFNGFPVYVQGFRHIPSLDTIVHKVNASLNQGINDLVHQLSSVNIHPPLPFPYRDRGRGTSVRIGNMEATYLHKIIEHMKQEARADVLGRIHRIVDHRLDNIRGYADRPNPNGQEILALVAEICTKLQEISIHE